MAQFSLPGIKISGLAAAVPSHKEFTADYKWIAVKERESLIKNIGVESRRVATKGTTTSDLCVEAAGKSSLGAFESCFTLTICHGLVLQWALATLVANWAIKWVIN